MKLRTLIPTALAAVLSMANSQSSIAAPVTPYTEHFTSDEQDWINGKSMLLATWESSGGPDGSSYASATMNTATNNPNSSRVVFRGNSTAAPELHASDDKFHGDWLAGGINHFSAWVYHEAPEALPYFVRIATEANSPAVAIVDGTMVQPSTWTKLDYVIHPSYINLTIIPESSDDPAEQLATFNTVFGLVERIQIGYSVPASMSNGNPPGAAISYKYGIDQVSVYTGEIPEPASWCLAMTLAGLGVVRRRRHADLR